MDLPTASHPHSALPRFHPATRTAELLAALCRPLCLTASIIWIYWLLSSDPPFLSPTASPRFDPTGCTPATPPPSPSLSPSDSLSSLGSCRCACSTSIARYRQSGWRLTSCQSASAVVANPHPWLYTRAVDGACRAQRLWQTRTHGCQWPLAAALGCSAPSHPTLSYEPAPVSSCCMSPAVLPSSSL